MALAIPMGGPALWALTQRTASAGIPARRIIDFFSLATVGCSVPRPKHLDSLIMWSDAIGAGCPPTPQAYYPSRCSRSKSKTFSADSFTHDPPPGCLYWIGGMILRTSDNGQA